jgi:hypothetical protein
MNMTLRNSADDLELGMIVSQLGIQGASVGIDASVFDPSLVDDEGSRGPQGWR